MASVGSSANDCGADIGLHTPFVESRCGPPSMEMAVQGEILNPINI